MITIPAELHTAVDVDQTPQLFDADEAVFDLDRIYRFALTRNWGPGGRALFMMLNPSTADAGTNDPTLRRCIGFAREHGYGGIVVVNLFALRSTDPANLAEHPDPVGPYNDVFIAAVAASADRHIVAWGAHGTPSTVNRAATVTDTLTRLLSPRGLGLWCLGTTSGGQPRHPLYLPGGTTLQPYLPPTHGEICLAGATS